MQAVDMSTFKAYTFIFQREMHVIGKKHVQKIKIVNVQNYSAVKRIGIFHID